MTVEELIEELEKVEDKEASILLCQVEGYALPLDKLDIQLIENSVYLEFDWSLVSDDE